MRRFIFAVTVILLMLSLAACGFAADRSDSSANLHTENGTPDTEHTEPVKDETAAPKVYFTSSISPEGLTAVYAALDVELTCTIAGCNTACPAGLNVVMINKHYDLALSGYVIGSIRIKQDKPRYTKGKKGDPLVFLFGKMSSNDRAVSRRTARGGSIINAADSIRAFLLQFSYIFSFLCFTNLKECVIISIYVAV